MSKPSVLNSIERKFILLVGDLIMIIAALNLLVNHAIDEKYSYLWLKVQISVIGLILFLFLAYILDFYNLEKLVRRRTAISQGIYISVIFIFTLIMICIIFYDISFWRIPLLSFLFLTPIQVALWRLLYSNLFKIIPVTKNVLLLYDGYDLNLKSIIEKINGAETNTFYKVKLTYHIEGNDLTDRKSFLEAIQKVDAWIINTESYEAIPPYLQKIILKSIMEGKEIISYTSFYENTYEALPVNSHNDSFYEILQLRNKKIRYLQALFSFMINFGLSLFVGLIFVICIPFVFVCNVFFNRGPLFYTQKRVGQYGKEFTIYKFRSMVVDAEKLGAKMATKNDARITPFGRVLRLFRIDELPQIISVVRGDMRFIGPRPERKVFVKELVKIIPFYNIRHVIKPGITGWAQVKYKYGENLEDSTRKLEYDLYYIKNRSIMLDLRIIFKTFTTVIFSRGV
ncbi:sugar transferase [Muriicola marianensis]|uniref:Sugar transferase n=1 Tax=Muriicola marianensis TaxID=1324801 RepID=A0ABQ1QY79_9FLAO|nr:sugar transferase [Muriicola marianensis]GGD49756.1 sugar transferase [Muriicola marianensis]